MDASEAMVKRAQEKAKDRQPNVDFKSGDVQRLPFDPDTFDVVISECTVCYLDKEADWWCWSFTAAATAARSVSSRRYQGYQVVHQAIDRLYPECLGQEPPNHREERASGKAEKSLEKNEMAGSIRHRT